MTVEVSGLQLVIGIAVLVFGGGITYLISKYGKTVIVPVIIACGVLGLLGGLLNEKDEKTRERNRVVNEMPADWQALYKIIHETVNDGRFEREVIENFLQKKRSRINLEQFQVLDSVCEAYGAYSIVSNPIMEFVDMFPDPIVIPVDSGVEDPAVAPVEGLAITIAPPEVWSIIDGQEGIFVPRENFASRVASVELVKSD